MKISHTVHEYKFRDLEMNRDIPYLVELRIYNNAGLISHSQTSPVLFDNTRPSAGKVVEGINFRDDVVWWGETSSIEGMTNHKPNIPVVPV